MKYDGLTSADKPALDAAKSNGAEWIARDRDGAVFGYLKKPTRHEKLCLWQNTGENDWWRFKNDWFKFIQWSDPEPVHIDTALAQIAKMEQKKSGCKYCDGGVPLTIGETNDYGIALKRMTDGAIHLLAYGYDVHGSGSNGLHCPINFCPNCGNKLINS